MLARCCERLAQRRKGMNESSSSQHRVTYVAAEKEAVAAFQPAVIVVVGTADCRLARCVPCWSGGGVEEGNRAGFAAGLNAKVFPKTYRVSELLPTQADGSFSSYLDLIDEIIAGVQPASWEGAGGPATLAPYPQNLSLVVSQTARGHDELSEFLEAKRKDLRRDSQLR